MTESSARRQNLSFTGYYSHSREEMKEKASELRKTYGCRAVLVNTPSGTSVYADRVYFLKNNLKNVQETLNNMDQRRKYEETKFLERMKELDNEEEKLKESLKKLKENLLSLREEND